MASLHTGLQCYQPYKSRSVKNKASTDGRTDVGLRRSLFAQDDDEVFVTGSTLYAGDGGHPPPRIQPTFSAAIGHRGTELSRYFCWKLTLTRTPDPIRPTRQAPDPNRPKNGSKQGGYDLGVSVQGVLVRHRRRQQETTEQNLIEFYALVNLKPQ